MFTSVESSPTASPQYTFDERLSQCTVSSIEDSPSRASSIAGDDVTKDLLLFLHPADSCLLRSLGGHEGGSAVDALATCGGASGVQQVHDERRGRVARYFVV